MMTPYDSLYTLLHTGSKQIEALQYLDTLNDKRRKLQDTMVKAAEKMMLDVAAAHRNGEGQGDEDI